MKRLFDSRLSTRMDLPAFLLLLVLVPLACGGEMRLMVPRGALAIAIVIMVISNLRFPSPDMPLRYFLWMCFAWLLYGTLSLFWTPAVDVGVKQVIAIFLGMALAAVIATLLLSCEERAKWARKAWIIAFLLTLPIAVQEVRTDQHRPSSVADHAETGGLESVSGKFAAVTFGNRNGYVSFLCLTVPALLIEMSAARKRFLVAFYFALTAAAFVLVAIDASRLGIATLAGQLLAVLWLSGRSKGILFKIIIISLIVVGYFAIKASQFTQIRLESALSGDDESFARRVDYSARGLMLVGDSAGMGIGAGAYNEAAEGGFLLSAHNVWIEIAADYGVLIAAGFIAALFYSFARLWRAVLCGRRIRGEFDFDALYGLLLVATLPAIGIVNSSCIASTLFWAAIGIVVGTASVPQNESFGILPVPWRKPLKVALP